MFPPASQAGCLAGPVFYVDVFSLLLPTPPSQANMGSYVYVGFPTSNLPSLWIYTSLGYTECGDCDVCTAGHSADRR